MPEIEELDREFNREHSRPFRRQRTKAETVKRCVEKGWAETWFTEQVEPGWPVHRLTAEGLAILTRRGERS